MCLPYIIQPTPPFTHFESRVSRCYRWRCGCWLWGLQNGCYRILYSTACCCAITSGARKIMQLRWFIIFVYLLRISLSWPSLILLARFSSCGQDVTIQQIVAQSWLVNMHIAIVSIAKCISGTCVLSAATTQQQQQKRPTRHVRLTIQSEGADDDDESLHWLHWSGVAVANSARRYRIIKLTLFSYSFSAFCTCTTHQTRKKTRQW